FDRAVIPQQRNELSGAGGSQTSDRVIASLLPIDRRCLDALGTLAKPLTRRIPQLPNSDESGATRRCRRLLNSADQLIAADARGLVARRDLAPFARPRHGGSEFFGGCPRRALDRRDRHTGAVAQIQDRRSPPRHVVGERVRQWLASCDEQGYCSSRKRIPAKRPRHRNNSA